MADDRITGGGNINFLLGHAYQEFNINTFRFASSNFLVPSISAIDDPGNATSVVGVATSLSGLLIRLTKIIYG